MTIPTNVAALNAGLDLDPGNHTLRLILADAVQEEGDVWLAAGIREIVAQDRVPWLEPTQCGTEYRYVWADYAARKGHQCLKHQIDRIDRSELPSKMFLESSRKHRVFLIPSHFEVGDCYCEFGTRRQAELVLATEYALDLLNQKQDVDVENPEWRLEIAKLLESSEPGMAGGYACMAQFRLSPYKSQSAPGKWWWASGTVGIGTDLPHGWIEHLEAAYTPGMRWYLSRRTAEEDAAEAWAAWQAEEDPATRSGV